MRLFITVAFTILCIGCTGTKQTSFDYNKSQNPWVDAFKDRAFFACLKESYKNESIFKLIENEDAFNPYDGLSPEATELARNSGLRISRNIPPPAMCEGCTKGENYYMATCLHYYKSKELDSIAYAEYKKYLNTK